VFLPDADPADYKLLDKSIDYDNMLDLTDPKVLNELGIDSDSITKLNGADRYELTQAIGDAAREQGFAGIIAPSAPKAGGINIITFESMR